MKMFLILIVSTIIYSQDRREIGNLILEDIPEIPQEIEDRSRQYRNTRSASCRSWLRDGSGMIIGTRFGETSQIHIVERSMGARRQITFFEEPVSGGISCPDPESNGFLFSKDIGGSEFYQIHYFDLNSGGSTMLTDGRSRNGLGPWSNSGKNFAFTSNMGNGVDMSVYIGDLNGDHTPLVQEKGFWFPRNWSPDDSKLLVGKYVSINESYIHIVNVGSGRMTQFNPKDEKISYGNAAFSKDGKGIYYSSDEGTEFRHLRYYDLAKGHHKILTDHIPWDVQDFSQSDNGRYLAYITNEDAISRLHLVRTAGFKEMKIPELPMGRIGGLDFSPDGSRLAVNLNAPKTPGDVYVLNIRNRGLVQWTQSEVGGLDTESFSEPELIYVRSFDGLDVPAFIYRPIGSGPHPVVVYIHGGPESQFRPSFSSRIQYWVKELGVAVLATNVRGSSGFGKTYVQLDNGYKREDSVKDIGAFLDWISDQSDLDQERVSVFGGSYGGYMVLASMTHYNERLRCAIDVVGISNFVSFLRNTESYRRDLRRAEYGDERDPDMRLHLERISPNNNAKKITKPIFIVQGYNDPRVPVTEAEQMRDVIRSNGGDVWYMVAMDEGHGFSKKFNRDYYTNAVSLFLERYLLD